MSVAVACGFDIGSSSTKVVIIDNEKNIIHKLIKPTHPRIEEQITEILDQLERENFPVRSMPIIATGYGRKLMDVAKKQVTEITCHARGVYEYFKHGGSLIDIGGQDSKVIHIGDNGRVLDFAMNDKCAAGTGRFLENTSARLAIPIERIGFEAENANDEAQISSTCTIFAESEIISLLAHGEKVEVILKGLHRSLIKRIMAMVNSISSSKPFMLSGGVVQNSAIRSMLTEALNTQLLLPEFPQFMGAYGAALVALSN